MAKLSWKIKVSMRTNKLYNQNLRKKLKNDSVLNINLMKFFIIIKKIIV